MLSAQHQQIMQTFTLETTSPSQMARRLFAPIDRHAGRPHFDLGPPL